MTLYISAGSQDANTRSCKLCCGPRISVIMKEVNRLRTRSVGTFQDLVISLVILQSSKNEQKHNCCWNLATSLPAGSRILWMAVTTKGDFTLNTVSFFSLTSQLIQGMVSTLVMVLIHDSRHSYSSHFTCLEAE